MIFAYALSFQSDKVEKTKLLWTKFPQQYMDLNLN